MPLCDKAFGGRAVQLAGLWTEWTASSFLNTIAPGQENFYTLHIRFAKQPFSHSWRSHCLACLALSLG